MLFRSGPRRALADRLKVLSKSQVFVGIPAEKTLRKNGEMNNATLLFIHTNGSAIANIPARPVIEPAIEDAKGIIAPELAAAAAAVLDADPTAANQHLRKAGMIGANAAKKWFTSPKNNWAPNAPSTIRQKGSARPLIDQGELRRSLTYVVAETDSVPSVEEQVDDFNAAEADAGEAVTLGKMTLLP